MHDRRLRWFYPNPFEYGPSAYDRFRQTHSDQDIFRGSDVNQIFQEMTRAFGFRGFEEVFRESYGQGYQSFEFRRPGVFGRVIFFGPGFRRAQRRVSPTEGSPLPSLPTGIFGKLLGYVLKRVWGIERYQKGRDWHEAITLTPWQAMQGEKIRCSSAKSPRIDRHRPSWNQRWTASAV